MFRKSFRLFTPLIHSRSMSFESKGGNDIRFLATYGTLRDDDNSGAIWAKDFTKGISSAMTGRIVGYRLFGNSVLRYPFATYTGNPEDSLVVRLLSWPTKEQFVKKIQDADRIEGDDYERKIVDVIVDNGIERAYVYIAKTSDLSEDWKIIPSGDWLQRDFK